MMKRISILYFILLTLCSLNLKAQKAEILKADKKYNSYAFIDAIKSYERIVEKGYKSADLYEKIANAYFFNAELAKAAKWYGLLIDLVPNVDPEYYFRYANCLRSVGEHDKAAKMLVIYNQKSTSVKGELYSRDINYLDKIEANSNRYTIKDANINTPYADYGSAFYRDSLLVFTSARVNAGTSKRKHTWTNQSFTHLYEVKLTDSLKTGKPIGFSKKIQSKFNDASAIFTKDGNTMYFTRNNFLNGKKGKDKNNTILIKVYRASFINNDWTNIVELPFNSDEYSAAHPALSADEKTLYFASDMPGTLGGSDIFKVSINSDNTYGTPVNLGNTINTPGRETFPFVSDENELYFSSDTHSGLGGLDIFVSQIDEEENTYSEVQNLGKDINSPRDDFAYLINTKTRYGFFSSNRDKGKGFDDIYHFLETRKMLKPTLSGLITDLATGVKLPNAKVLLYDNVHKLIDSALSDANGRYSFSVKNSKSYTVTAKREDYNINGKGITIPKHEMNNKLDIALEQNKCKITIGGDLAKCFGITMIYFDLDKSNIRPDAAIDLAKILDVLIEYPNMKIDIRSHTDSRASFKYNEALSDRRAKSTREWLIKNGINGNRLTAKGFGEYQLINKCADGVLCTEEAHQQNRRSEFIVTAL